MSPTTRFTKILWIYCLASLTVTVYAQQIIPARKPFEPLPPVVIIPPARPIPRAAVEITAIDVKVDISKQIATTHIVVHLKNTGALRQEAVVVLPVPDKVTVRGFDFAGSGKEPTARLMRREKARAIYNEIVGKMKDPAILEFAGMNLIRSSVFPVEPYKTQRITLIYEQILTADGSRRDYCLPRSESLSCNVPWNVKVTLKADTPISTVYSPSHDVVTKRISPKCLEIALAKSARRNPGSFRLSYLMEQSELTASIMAYPTRDGGYFLFMAGLPTGLDVKEIEAKVKREVIIVIDRSGSMRGEKIKQAKEAALQVVAGLSHGELFNLITYNGGVNAFRSKPITKTKQTMQDAMKFIDAITARGGTNIHDALVEALNQKRTDPKSLPIILFLTDGVPTIGQTDEKTIRDAAKKNNEYNRRIFTFGVGVDVNTPLLDSLADDSRAVATYVLPKEDVEVKVGGVFKRLYGPVLAMPTIVALEDNGNETLTLIEDLIPIKMPDVFIGDQIVMLGRYKTKNPLILKLKGNYLGNDREFKFEFNPQDSTTSNAFVPRLWASRKIATLIQAIRDMGADPGVTVDKNDEKLKELVDEVVKLSLEFGILTEYTAYLAREGTDLTQSRDTLNKEAEVLFKRRAMQSRTGIGGVNQSLNASTMKQSKKLNVRNVYYDKEMKLVEVASIQQVNDLALYKRQGRWVDSKVMASKNSDVYETISFGTKKFDEILDRLIKLNRQGSLAMGGDVMIELDGKNVLIKF